MWVSGGSVVPFEVAGLRWPCLGAFAMQPSHLARCVGAHRCIVHPDRRSSTDGDHHARKTTECHLAKWGGSFATSGISQRFFVFGNLDSTILLEGQVGRRQETCAYMLLTPSLSASLSLRLCPLADSTLRSSRHALTREVEENLTSRTCKSLQIRWTAISKTTGRPAGSEMSSTFHPSVLRRYFLTARNWSLGSLVSWAQKASARPAETAGEKQ